MIGIFGTYLKRLREYLGGNSENSEQKRTNEKDIEMPGDTHNNNVDDDENKEDTIQVHKMVLDNELGGLEVTVLPS